MGVVKHLGAEVPSWVLKVLRTLVAVAMGANARVGSLSSSKRLGLNTSVPGRLRYIIHLLEPRARGDGVINVDLTSHLVAT